MKYDKPLISNPSSLISFLQTKRQQKKFMKTIEMSATFLLICFFLIFAIRPTVTTITALIAEINNKKELSDKFKNKINSIIQAQTVYSQAQADYDLINSSLPDTYRFSQVSTQIKAISQNANIAVSDIDFGLHEEDDYEQTAYYSHTINQPIAFNDISTILLDLDNNRRCHQLTNLSLSLRDLDKLSDEEIAISSHQTEISIDTNFFYWK